MYTNSHKKKEKQVIHASSDIRTQDVNWWQLSALKIDELMGKSEAKATTKLKPTDR